MPRDGTKNLIPFNMRTEEERKEISIRAGKASGEARRKKRNFKQCIELIGNSKFMDNKVAKQVAEFFGIEEDEPTFNLVAVYKQFENAIKRNDTRAIEFLRDTVGEKPSTNQNIKMDIEDLSALGDLINANDTND